MAAFGVTFVPSVYALKCSGFSLPCLKRCPNSTDTWLTGRTCLMSCAPVAQWARWRSFGPRIDSCVCSLGLVPFSALRAARTALYAWKPCLDLYWFVFSVHRSRFLNFDWPCQSSSALQLTWSSGCKGSDCSTGNPSNRHCCCATILCLLLKMYCLSCCALFVGRHWWMISVPFSATIHPIFCLSIDSFWSMCPSLDSAFFLSCRFNCSDWRVLAPTMGPSIWVMTGLFHSFGRSFSRLWSCYDRNCSRISCRRRTIDWRCSPYCWARPTFNSWTASCDSVQTSYSSS